MRQAQHKGFGVALTVTAANPDWSSYRQNRCGPAVLEALSDACVRAYNP